MNRHRDPDEDVELGARVEARTRGASHAAVFVVRVPRDLLVRMTEFGQGRGMTVSEVLLHGAERLTRARKNHPADSSD